MEECKPLAIGYSHGGTLSLPAPRTRATISQLQGLSHVHLFHQFTMFWSLNHINHPVYPLKGSYVESKCGRVQGPAGRCAPLWRTSLTRPTR